MRIDVTCRRWFILACELPAAAGAVPVVPATLSVDAPAGAAGNKVPVTSMRCPLCLTRSSALPSRTYLPVAADASDGGWDGVCCRSGVVPGAPPDAVAAAPIAALVNTN